VVRVNAWLPAVVLLFGLPQIVEACPICFRDPDSPMSAGVVAGVGTLMAATGAVLSGFGVLVRRLIRAERAVAEPER
jgi:hypothetical protein